jgi:CheY-like chemotaxis protein
MVNLDKKTRVLLVDDNLTHQYSLSRHLADSGFEVMQAHTGAEALALVSQVTPDVVLLDIHLPDVLGFDVCQTLKSDLATKNIPVVFHSATLDTQLAKAIATDLGAVAFLTYPIDIDHLISVVRGAVARRS